MLINESGIVVFSFFVDHKGYNVCPWLWWSVYDGIHLSEEPLSYQLVSKFNNEGYILIQEFLQCNSFRLHLKYYNNEKESYVYEFNPMSELTPYTYEMGRGLMPGFENDLVKMLFMHKNIFTKKVNDFKIFTFGVDELDDDLNIQGYGSIVVRFCENADPVFWCVYIRYEIHEHNAKFIIDNIKEEFVARPKRFYDLDGKIIFEKNFAS